ncbi:MAG: ADP-forming succinate--CoA ligase subunit beta [Elusimicrobia bacterium]|nr:ADP-forming succinate--CoA ligase subunit beta [Elusimicrobiota bacterium]
MKLEEFEAKKILESFQIPIPPYGGVVTGANEVSSALKRCGPAPWILKAQVQTGGRGKAGGIKKAKTLSEAKEIVSNLLGKKLITAQTGADGILVKKVLIEKGASIQKELYLSLTLDRKQGKMILIASACGGMEIEEIAQTSPGKIEKIEVSVTSGIETYQARELLLKLGLYDSNSKLVQERIKFIKKCVKAALSIDASLLEINPLALTENHQLIALDAKIVIDDNALFRHPEFKTLESSLGQSSAERQAKKAGISYISLKGNIGCMVNGAGLAMATMDIIKQHGGEPANFLDVGGGASVQQVTTAFKIILSDKNVKAILVNIFGGIMKCDVIAQGIVTAVEEIKLTIPIVVRLEGTRAEEGRKILAQSGLNITSTRSFKESAEKVVELATGTIVATPHPSLV